MNDMNYLAFPLKTVQIGSKAAKIVPFAIFPLFKAPLLQNLVHNPAVGPAANSIAVMDNLNLAPILQAILQLVCYPQKTFRDKTKSSSGADLDEELILIAQ